MSMDWNDPKLTAYALGELSGQEAKEMEELVNKSEEARKYVEDVKKTARMLEAELRGESLPRLSHEERAKVLKSTSGGSSRWWMWSAGGLVAAGVAAIFIAQPMLKAPESTQMVARDEEVMLEQTPTESELAARPIDRAPTPPSKAKHAWKTKADDPSEAKIANDTSTGDAAAQEGKLEAPRAAARGADKKMLMRESTLGHGSVGAVRHFGKGGVHFQDTPQNTDSHSFIQESDFVRVADHPLSTFSIDVDTASYSMVRRYLNSGQLPPVDAVRIEELLNYFPYAYASPKDTKPFAVNVEQTRSPWKPEHRLVRIGLKGREIDLKKRPKSNLVFLLDVSGSMEEEDRLPLLRSALTEMVKNLTDNDRVAIVVYAGSSGLVLPPTSDQNEIVEALGKLQAGGSTNGGAGIELAYNVAEKNFIPGGTNRVILATDGDFNVGTTNESELVRLIERQAKKKIFLSVLGFGTGNYKDSTMEKLADKGDGNYAYIDSAQEAKKALVDQLAGTLVTIAKDVKIQVEFNPKYVAGYRLIGYENRTLAKEDFNDDQKDAGEIGSGHTVTALYEIVPKGVPMPVPAVDALKYAKPKATPDADENDSNELLTVKLRYKQPEGDTSQLIEVPVPSQANLHNASPDMKFAMAVTQFGMLLRDSKWKGSSSFGSALRLAEQGKKRDAHRAEFIELLKKARDLKARKH